MLASLAVGTAGRGPDGAGAEAAALASDSRASLVACAGKILVAFRGLYHEGRPRVARVKGLAYVGGPCHVQARFAGANRRMWLGVSTSTADKLKLAAIALDRRGGGGFGPEVPRLLGDGQRRALFGRAREHRQPDHGAGGALCHPRLGPAGRPPPPVRSSQGRVLLRRARGRADRRRGAADLPRSLRRIPSPARAERAAARARHQRPRHGRQRGLVVLPADLGTTPAFAGAGGRRLASADRCRDLRRRDHRPAAGDADGLAAARSGAGRPGRRQHPVGGLAPGARIGERADGRGRRRPRSPGTSDE